MHLCTTDVGAFNRFMYLLGTSTWIWYRRQLSLRLECPYWTLHSHCSSLTLTRSNHRHSKTNLPLQVLRPAHRHAQHMISFVVEWVEPYRDQFLFRSSSHVIDSRRQWSDSLAAIRLNMESAHCHLLSITRQEDLVGNRSHSIPIRLLLLSVFSYIITC